MVDQNGWPQPWSDYAICSWSMLFVYLHFFPPIPCFPFMTNLEQSVENKWEDSTD